MSSPLAMDAAVLRVLRERGHGNAGSVGRALGLEVEGLSPEAQATFAEVEAALRRVARPGRLGEWLPPHEAADRAPEPRFRLELLAALWGRCWMDKPARVSDLEREYGHKLDLMRDAVRLLEVTRQVVLTTPRRGLPRYVTTDRSPTGEHRAARIVLAHVRGLGIETAPELATALGIHIDTAEALLLALKEKSR